MCAQSSPVLCTMYAVTDVGVGLVGVIVSMWLAMRLFPFIHISPVLYMCTIGTLHMIPSYWYGTCGLTSVSSGMTWGYIWGGCLFARPGVIVTFAFLITL